jgi:hypothetical protein
MLPQIDGSGEAIDAISSNLWVGGEWAASPLRTRGWEMVEVSVIAPACDVARSTSGDGTIISASTRATS